MTKRTECLLCHYAPSLHTYEDSTVATVVTGTVQYATTAQWINSVPILGAVMVPILGAVMVPILGAVMVPILGAVMDSTCFLVLIGAIHATLRGKHADWVRKECLKTCTPDRIWLHSSPSSKLATTRKRSHFPLWWLPLAKQWDHQLVVPER